MNAMEHAYNSEVHHKQAQKGKRQISAHPGGGHKGVRRTRVFPVDSGPDRQGGRGGGRYDLSLF